MLLVILSEPLIEVDFLDFTDAGNQINQSNQINQWSRQPFINL